MGAATIEPMLWVSIFASLLVFRPSHTMKDSATEGAS
jgi:hypothetical protein